MACDTIGRDRLRRFVSFVNAPAVADPDLAYVAERGQRRPAPAGSSTSAPDDGVPRTGPTLVAGPTLQVMPR